MFITSTEPTDRLGDPLVKHKLKDVHHLPHAFPIDEIEVCFVNDPLTVKECAGRVVSPPLMNGFRW